MVKTTNPQSWSKIGQNWSSISLNIPLHGNWDNGAGTNVLETVPTQADGINKSSLMLVQFYVKIGFVFQATLLLSQVGMAGVRNNQTKG